MKWPIDELSTLMPMPDGSRLEQLKRANIASFVAAIKGWHPDNQAVYAKLLVPEDEVLRPDPKNLTPKARALFELLFSD